MAESAALLVDEVLPEQPIRQWVLSFPFQLRFLFASRPELMGRVLGIVYRAISSHLIKKSGLTRKTAQTGAVTLIQRFGSALNLNVHFEQRHQAMTWAQRLKRVFNIDVSVCPTCGGDSRVIACIEEQAVIDKILAHLMKKGALPPPPELLPATRASPDTGWFA